MKTYSRHIDEIVAAMGISGNSTTKFIWHESPSMPPTFSEQKLKENDLITNSRISEFNSHYQQNFIEIDFTLSDARAKMLGAGYPVIGAFDVSLQFNQDHASKDLMHWFDTPALTAIMDITAHHLGLCSIEEKGM